MIFATDNSHCYKNVTGSIIGNIIVNHNNGGGGSNHVVVTGGDVRQL